MPKILNLDKLAEASAATQRALKINGKDYPIHGMTVDNFIQTSLDAERIAKAESVVEQIQATIDMICRSVPSLPREVIGGYSLEVLSSITIFVRGEDVDGQEEQATEGEAGN